MKKQTLGIPRCPNHGEPLQLDSTQKGHTKGASPCPLSGMLFDWVQDVEASSFTKDKNGNLVEQKAFLVEGED